MARAFGPQDRPRKWRAVESEENQTQVFALFPPPWEIVISQAVAALTPKSDFGPTSACPRLAGEVLPDPQWPRGQRGCRGGASSLGVSVEEGHGFGVEAKRGDDRLIL